MYVSMEVMSTSGCCGVMQLTEFITVYDTKPSWHNMPLSGMGKTVEEAYTDLFNNLRAFEFTDDRDDDYDFHCAVVQIWFVKQHDYNGVDNEHYEAETLRQLVETIPNVRNLGEYRNPNTNNLIQGYQWAV